MFAEERDGALDVRAFAKVNLYLEVAGKRPDGFHELRSVLTPVSLCDRVRLTPDSGGACAVSLTGGTVDLDDLTNRRPEDNLAMRAAALLKQETGAAAGARIELEKNVPIGGGMGGGSSDAAAVLLGLNRLWNLGLDVPTLARLGARLGCDVPALLYDGAVAIGGAGETVTPIPVTRPEAREGWWLVIANPRLVVSTRDIYERYRPDLTSSPQTYKNIIFSLQSGDVRLAGENLFNGLQPTVARKYPLIGELVDELKIAGALGALVSGSGASAFGLAESEDHAHGVEGRLKRRMGEGVWTCVARTLPDGVMAAHGPLEARV